MRIPRISLSNLFFLMVCVGILMAWWNDRRRMHAEFEAILNPRPRWGNCQAEGAPDTRGAGDIATAWASATPDGQREWLVAEYHQPLLAQSIEVHETYNPGAVDKICGLDRLGHETILWQGIDPAPAGAKRSVSIFPIRTKQKFKRFKIYIDSQRVAGWNEIDAIGVRTGLVQKNWALKITSSSSYGDRYSNTDFFRSGGGIISR